MSKERFSANGRGGNLGAVKTYCDTYWVGTVIREAFPDEGRWVNLAQDLSFDETLEVLKKEVKKDEEVWMQKPNGNGFLFTGTLSDELKKHPARIEAEKLAKKAKIKAEVLEKGYIEVSFKNYLNGDIDVFIYSVNETPEGFKLVSSKDEKFFDSIDEVLDRSNYSNGCKAYDVSPITDEGLEWLKNK